MGLSFLRPSDYYAVMVKFDADMGKVKSRLLYENKWIEEAEERRKAREAKRIAKEVHSEKLKESAKQKKDQIESVKKRRKQRQQNGFASDNRDDFPFEDGVSLRGQAQSVSTLLVGIGPGGKGKQLGKGKNVIDKKRKNRDFREGKLPHE
ncbi:hypothetical protein Dimus_018820 [Dionaea muscipula]